MSDLKTVERDADAIIGEFNETMPADRTQLGLDVARISEIIQAGQDVGLNAFKLVSMALLKGKMLSRAGRAKEARRVLEVAVERYRDDGDVRARHQVDIARTYLAETLLLDCHEPEQGSRVLTEVIDSFVACVDLHKPYKALMLIDLAHIALSASMLELTNSVCETLLAEPERAQTVPVEVRAQAWFYLAATKGTTDSAWIGAEWLALMEAKEAGLVAMDRIDERFGAPSMNVAWHVQVGMCRGLILRELGRRDEARAVWADLAPRVAQAWRGGGMRALYDEIGREL